MKHPSHEKMIRKLLDNAILARMTGQPRNYKGKGEEAMRLLQENEEIANRIERSRAKPAKMTRAQLLEEVDALQMFPAAFYKERTTPGGRRIKILRTNKEIIEEYRKTREFVFREAVRLGIEIKGKTFRQICEELVDKV